MNSEELELSLRTEFESYLKGYLAELRQEVSEFQKNFETEFEKHKSQTDEAVRKLVQRFDTGVHFDQAFNESVIEHLRLARDEGATITAVAIGEAEKLKEASAPAVVEYDKLRDAINEISSKNSQSEILKSLVDHASTFAPRGAFFIVKNEHFVGWRAFGDEAKVDEATVRGIQFPISSDSVLSESVGTLKTSTAGAGAHADDNLFLEPLGFGGPDRMYAIPLVARGRGVAVLYADFGTEGVALNPEALETLVRVAGLTVELAAAAVQPVAVPQPVETQPAVAPVEEQFEQPAAEETSTVQTPVEQFEQPEESPAVEHFQTPVQEEAPAYSETPAYEETPSFDETPHQETYSTPVAEETGFEVTPSFEERTPAYEEETTAFEPVAESLHEEVTPEPVQEVYVEPVQETEAEPAQFERFGEVVVDEFEEVEDVTYFEPVEELAAAEPKYVEPEVVAEVVPEVIDEYVPAEAVAEEFPEIIEESAAEPVAEYVPQVETPVVEPLNGSSAPAVAEPIAEVASVQAARTKYRDRNVDLPIEVPEEERRLHNDARRFARLLVSEIKLYNEQKVADGRQSGDLYDRLREAIDRSRDMYDKRVQQPVADKFDYFHYELVTSLADGEDVKLGASYPGGKVHA
ncbi:MAG: hypothetical protein HOP17_13525 [Acidobacteria bacterium]|nr:hypothetical protein [Acidobacteriota bacterium]